MEGSKVLLSPDSVQFKRGTGTRRTFSRFVSVGFRKFCVVCMIFETCMNQTTLFAFLFCMCFISTKSKRKQTDGSWCEAQQFMWNTALMWSTAVMLNSFSGCQLMHFLLGVHVSVFDVQWCGTQNSLCYFVVFAFKHGESEFSKRDVTVYMSWRATSKMSAWIIPGGKRSEISHN